MEVSNANGLDSFIQESCLSCHDASTETGLDFTSLGDQLENDQVFRKWVHVFDRVERGEMPPATESPPSEESRLAAMSLLKSELTLVNQRSQQSLGRVPSRRLSRKEYEHTLHDLLGIGGDLAKHLPPENESGAFDVVAATQEMSSVHVRSLLMAADLALDEAIQLGRKPPMAKRGIDYFHSRYIQMWVDRPVRQGGGTIFKTDQDVDTFRGENFVFRSDTNGFRPPVAGQYRVAITAAAHQPRSSITVSLKRQNDQQGESELLAAWDLAGSDYREVETITYLRPDDSIYVSADELDPALDGGVIYNSQPASTFGGEGVKIRRVTVEGPLEKSWPPERTRKLFSGVEWQARSESRQDFRRGLQHERRTTESLDDFRYYNPVLTRPPIEHVRAIVAELAPRAFRRKVSDQEIDALVSLAKPSLDGGRDFVDSVRIPLRAILVSPQLLFLDNQTKRSESRQDFRPTSSHTEPAETLDEFRYENVTRITDDALASRLSYFLWRSLPDEELAKLATEGQLSDSKTLAAQVDRMLDDPKRDRFALECLDPVGGFRDRYRNSTGVKREISVGLRFLHKDYELGLPVDTSGVMADGFEFDDIREYKQQLRKSTEQVARNVLSKLITFSTGAEMEFADREEVKRILNETREDGYPLRSLIHQVVASRMFLNR